MAGQLKDRSELGEKVEVKAVNSAFKGLLVKGHMGLVEQKVECGWRGEACRGKKARWADCGRPGYGERLHVLHPKGVIIILGLLPDRFFAFLRRKFDYFTVHFTLR